MNRAFWIELARDFSRPVPRGPALAIILAFILVGVISRLANGAGPADWPFDACPVTFDCTCDDVPTVPASPAERAV